MRSRFENCEQPLAYPAGASPFHIKGEFYRQLAESVAHNDRKCEGGVTRVLEREGLLEFAGQAFLSSALYDVLPLPRIVMAVAEARGRDVYDLTSAMGQAAVEQQMTGVYSRFLSKLSTQTFCQRFDQVINHFYDFAPVSVSAMDSGARVLRPGIPLCIAEWWCLVTVPFVVVPLTASGARDVAASWRVEPRGLAHGVAVGDVVWDVRWAAAA